jgi:aldose 1-epimerase
LYILKEIEEQGLQNILLCSSDGKSNARICLNQGGRLSSLIFENTKILADFNSSAYKDNYASSILFPFANRIKDGAYAFNGTNYQLDCNDEDNNNALHGLVNNKTFTVSKKMLTSSYAEVKLHYKDQGRTKGFPFKYKIELTYTLTKSGINLKVNITNKAEKSFPFSLDWHPYFSSKDLNKSTINFESNQKYVFDNQKIMDKIIDSEMSMPFQIKDTKLDDGFRLENNKIEFLTPEYHLRIISTSENNFLQLYTPEDLNIIAIEPMTGAANNFNNQIGLQTLNPNENYDVEWKIIIKTLQTNQ